MSEISPATKALEAILARVTDWLKFAEAKNGALLVLSSALVATTSSRAAESAYQDWRPALYLIMVGASFAVVVALISFLPVLRAAFYYMAMLNADEGRNLLYFQNIAKIAPGDYLAAFLKDYALEATKTKKLESDLAHQIVQISRLATRKFWMFNVGAFPLLGSFVIALAWSVLKLTR